MHPAWQRRSSSWVLAYTLHPDSVLYAVSPRLQSGMLGYLDRLDQGDYPPVSIVGASREWSLPIWPLASKQQRLGACRVWVILLVTSSGIDTSSWSYVNTGLASAEYFSSSSTVVGSIYRDTDGTKPWWQCLAWHQEPSMRHHTYPPSLPSPPGGRDGRQTVE